jgi:predicted  nucleic acid-binding Zn-ribbon protein
MNEALAALYHLQQVDSALAVAQKEYHGLDQGQAELAAAEEARSAYAGASHDLHSTSGSLRAAELELQSVEAKKKEYEGKLYGGKVSAPRELEAMQHEIEALGRLRARLDETILGLMERSETVKVAEETTKEALARAEAALAAKQAAYRESARRLATTVRDLAAERKLRQVDIAPALLKRYEAIRAIAHGVGIARLEGGLCGACHTNLPANLIRNVKEALATETCENCGRLLCSVDAPSSSAAS